MIFSGGWLAQRLEAAEGANDAACAGAQAGSAVEHIAGGVAIFGGARSPLNRAIGLGLAGAVAEPAWEEVERFFHSRGARVSVDLCPLAAPELLELLARRNYRPAEFNNAVARLLGGAAPWPEDARVAPCDDALLWARTVGRGFFDRADLTEEELDVGLAVHRCGSAEAWLARAVTGEPAAGAALAIREGTAVLFADATISAYRGQGLHHALIRHRLNAALEGGCDLAGAVTVPGSASQRNYERLGFQVAYTKVLLTEG